jgi:hypothetical protein
MNFKQPVQDMLQESMMKELELARQAHIRSPQHIQNYLCRSLHTRQINYQSRDAHRFTSLDAVKDQVEGVFVSFSRKRLYTKMFIDELFQILKAKNILLYDILKYKERHLKKSWVSIYRAHYTHKFSRPWFFRKVKEIRFEAKELTERNKNLLGCMPMGSSRLSRYGILSDNEVGVSTGTHRYVSW